jgi:chromosome segregation ATPase
MATIRCPRCGKDNPAGGDQFCDFCGGRLDSPSLTSAHPASAAPHNETSDVLRLKAALDASERNAVALMQELEAARQKAIADALRDSEQRISEETRLKDSLAESTRTVVSLRSELEAARRQSEQQSPAEQRLRDGLAAGEQMIASLRGDLDAAREKAAAEAARDAEARVAEETRLKEHLAAGAQTIAELKTQLEAAHSRAADATTQAGHGLKETLAASERTIATLKRDLEEGAQRLTNDHKQQIAHKDTLIDELKKKLEKFAELEKKLQASVTGTLSARGSEQGAPAGTTITNKRQFGAVAMSVIAMLSTGAGGAGGYFLFGNDAQPAIVSELQRKLKTSDGLNQQLQTGLRELHEAYERVGQDLKTAQAQLSAHPHDAGAVSNDDVQRQLAEAGAANKDLQQRSNAIAAELEQRRQQVATQEQTIARLNQELQDAKSREANAGPRETKSQEPREVKPRPHRATDFESTIRKLEREYGREYGVPGYGR